MPTDPQAQPRHRAARAGGTIRTFEAVSSHRIHWWKALCAQAAAEMMGDRPPFECPLRLDAFWLFRRTKECDRPANRGRDLLFDKAKGDLDNLLKGPLDCVKGVLWRDDKQVCAGELQKQFCRPGEQPGLWMRLELGRPSTPAWVRRPALAVEAPRVPASRAATGSPARRSTTGLV